MVLFYRDTNSPSEAVKLFKKKFGNHHNIDPKTIKRLVKAFNINLTIFIIILEYLTNL